MCSSRGTGLTLGWKLNVAVVLQPSQWATSLAFDRDELRATILMGRSIWDEMYLILEQMTSNTGWRHEHRNVNILKVPKIKTHSVTVLSSYSILSSNEVNLIHDEKADVLDILPLFPAPGQYVPLVRCTHNDVTFPQQLQVSASLSSQQDHLLVQDVLELLMPVHKHLRD